MCIIKIKQGVSLKTEQVVSLKIQQDVSLKTEQVVSFKIQQDASFKLKKILWPHSEKAHAELRLRY